LFHPEKEHGGMAGDYFESMKTVKSSQENLLLCRNIGMKFILIFLDDEKKKNEINEILSHFFPDFNRQLSQWTGPK